MSEHERQPAAPEDQNTVRQPEEQSAERQPEARNPEPQPEGKKGLGRKVKDGLSFFKGNFHKFESEDEPAAKPAPQPAVQPAQAPAPQQQKKKEKQESNTITQGRGCQHLQAEQASSDQCVEQ